MEAIFRDDSAQLHTIEALAAAFIMIFVLAIVVQTTSLTPLSSSFTNQHIKLELQNLGNDILTTLDETPVSYTIDAASPTEPIPDPSSISLLKQSIIDWNVFYYNDIYSWTSTQFLSIRNNDNTNMNTPLTNALKFALIEKGIAFNVEVAYTDENGVARSSKMIWNGDPSENSVTVSRFIVLNDGLSEIPVGDKFDDSSILPDISPTTNLHNVAEVRLTLWVM